MPARPLPKRSSHDFKTLCAQNANRIFSVNCISACSVLRSLVGCVHAVARLGMFTDSLSLSHGALMIVPRIICPKCEKIQGPSQQCTRCGIWFDYPASIAKSVAGEDKAAPLPTFAQAERELILAAVARCGENPSAAARILGIGKSTIYRKLREYDGEKLPLRAT